MPILSAPTVGSNESSWNRFKEGIGCRYVNTGTRGHTEDCKYTAKSSARIEVLFSMQIALEFTSARTYSVADPQTAAECILWIDSVVIYHMVEVI